MSRHARIKAENQIYSVVTRVNDSRYIFQNNEVCEMFLDHLKETKEKLKFKLYAFVIMSSHVHLLIEPDDETADISEIMFYINGKFAQKYNLRSVRRGHFWMERFSSKLIECGQHLASSVAYFAMNPVKAGVTDNPLKFNYSSIHNYTDGRFGDLLDQLPEELICFVKDFLRLNNYVELLDKCTRIMKRFSFDLSKSKREQKYRHFVGSSGFVAKNTVRFELKSIPAASF